MANANVKEFTDANFEKEVLQSDVPVLVDFWAEYCPPCRTLAPTIDELANDFNGKVKVGKVNTEFNTGAAIKHGINAIPTVLIFKGGKEQRRFVGWKPKAELVDAIQKVLV